MPPGLSLARSRRGRPSRTISSTWPTVVGAASAHLAVNARLTDDNSFIQSDSINQVIEFGISGLDDGIFDIASVVALRVRFRAVGIESGAQLRAEVASEEARATSVCFAEFDIPETSMKEFSLVVTGNEIAPGVLSKILPSELKEFRVIFETIAAAKVRVAKVSVEAFFLPVSTFDDYFSSVPSTFSWSKVGGLTESIQAADGIVSLDDTSLSDFFSFSKEIIPLNQFGLAAVYLKVGVPTGWLSFDGVFGFTAIDLNILSNRFILNLLEEGGTRKIGLLKGDPDTFDPKLITSYEYAVDFEWESLLGQALSLEWDESFVYVYSSEDVLNPLMTVLKTSIGAGTVVTRASFGTGSASALGSRGNMLVGGFYFRGFVKA